MGGLPDMFFAENASSFAKQMGSQTFHPYVLFANGTTEVVAKSDSHLALCEFVGS